MNCQKRERQAPRCPDLSEAQVLAWADDWFERTGRWPNVLSGAIPGTDRERWKNLDHALRRGRRGLGGGTSLARLLNKHRRVRNGQNVPRLTVQQILVWAQIHYQATGAWPNLSSGAVLGARDETWVGIDSALRAGTRLLQGGSSLAQVLAHCRGTRNKKDLPPLTTEQVLAWADSHHHRTGKWPTCRSGHIEGSQGETWMNAHDALSRGGRGLPGHSSLAQLLAQHHRVRNRLAPPALTEEQVLTWADAHHQRTGMWPAEGSGRIAEAPEETWTMIDEALKFGRRSFPGGSSVARLLEQRRGKRRRQQRPELTEAQILAWADAHYQRTGQRPMIQSGTIPDSSGTTWQAVEAALRGGLRGFPGGSSLRRFLDEHGRPQGPRQNATKAAREGQLASGDGQGPEQ